jgi:hypothetical protein
LTQKKSGFVRTQRTNNDQLILVDPVDDEDVEEIRPRTDPSSVSDFGTGLGVILDLKRLDFSSTLCRDSLVSSELRVRYRIEYRIKPRISTCIHST